MMQSRALPTKRNIPNDVSSRCLETDLDRGQDLPVTTATHPKGAQTQKIAEPLTDIIIYI